jgi:anti-sigma regulatory factor (Ser/Thr protein kinase)
VAIPLGLALNELISNCLKHAFPNDRAGNITVALGHSPAGMELTLTDDGVGFPAGFEWRQCTSLGLHLVQILARQLQATVEVSSGDGTRRGETRLGETQLGGTPFRGTQFRLRFDQPNMAGRPFYESTQYSRS